MLVIGISYKGGEVITFITYYSAKPHKFSANVKLTRVGQFYFVNTNMAQVFVFVLHLGMLSWLIE